MNRHLEVRDMIRVDLGLKVFIGVIQHIRTGRLDVGDPIETQPKVYKASRVTKHKERTWGTSYESENRRGSTTGQDSMIEQECSRIMERNL